MERASRNLRELYFPRFPRPEPKATGRSWWDEVGVPEEVGKKALVSGTCFVLGAFVVLTIVLLAAFGVIQPQVRR